jgi:4'-phosphopantetheinyl transferase
VRVVGIEGQGDRPAARHAIRAALRDALAEWSGLSPERIDLRAEPGHAPYALLAHADGRVQRVSLAISHDGELSVAALWPDGAVGIDVMRIADVPDWEAVARDYLGPAAADALSARPDAQRPAAFAYAWSDHEARLKCLGLGLVEWDPELAERLTGCDARSLILPDGYAGHVALAPFG